MYKLKVALWLLCWPYLATAALDPSLDSSCDVQFDDAYTVSWEGAGKHIGYNIFTADKGAQMVKVKLKRYAGSHSCQFAIGLSEIPGATSNAEHFMTNGGNDLRFGVFLDQDLRIPWLGHRKDRGLQNMAIVTFSPLIQVTDNTDDTTSNTAGLLATSSLSLQQQRAISSALKRHAGKQELDSEEFEVYFHIPAGQIKPSGPYQKKMLLTAYEIAQTGFIAKDTQAITFKAKVKEIINASISKHPFYVEGDSKHYTINFGTPDFGHELRDDFYLNIRANGKFSYTFSSENKSKLKLFDSKPNANLKLKAEFPYSLFVNQKLDTGGTYHSPGSQTTKDGIAIPITALIHGDIDPIEYQPGSYKDSVHINIKTMQ